MKKHHHCTHWFILRNIWVLFQFTVFLISPCCYCWTTVSDIVHRSILNLPQISIIRGLNLGTSHQWFSLWLVTEQATNHWLNQWWQTNHWLNQWWQTPIFYFTSQDYNELTNIVEWMDTESKQDKFITTALCRASTEVSQNWIKFPGLYVWPCGLWHGV